MKKFLMTALAVLASACMLFAGGSNESSTAASSDGSLSGTLTIWSMLTQTERATELENLAAEFEAANPGVDVTISVMPWSGALDKLMASIMAGNPPDISVVGQGYVQTLSESGGLLEISDFIDSIGGPDQFLGTSLSVLSAGMDGGIYSVPLYVTPVVAYYRRAGLMRLDGQAVSRRHGKSTMRCARLLQILRRTDMDSEFRSETTMERRQSGHSFRATASIS